MRAVACGVGLGCLQMFIIAEYSRARQAGSRVERVNTLNNTAPLIKSKCSLCLPDPLAWWTDGCLMVMWCWLICLFAGFLGWPLALLPSVLDELFDLLVCLSSLFGWLPTCFHVCLLRFDYFFAYLPPRLFASSPLLPSLPPFRFGIKGVRMMSTSWRETIPPHNTRQQITAVLVSVFQYSLEE